MKFFIKDFFNRCDQICRTSDLVLFTEETLNGKLHFLYSNVRCKQTCQCKKNWSFLLRMFLVNMTILESCVKLSSSKRHTLGKKYPYSDSVWSAFFPVQVRENAGKMQTRITPNMDTFYAVIAKRTHAFLL